MGRKARLTQGHRRRPAPLSRSPGLAGPIQAPGRKARPRRAWASRGRGARARPPRARGGRAGPVRAHRGDLRQGGDAFGGGPHGPAPRGSGTRDCPREKCLAGRRGSAAGSDAPSFPAISEAPSPPARRRLIYKMVGMPTISLPASLGRLPRRRPKWANRGERPAPLPMRRKKRRERRSSYLANP